MGVIVELPVSRRLRTALAQLEPPQDEPVRRLLDAPGFSAAIRQLAQSFVTIHEVAPRTAALFATQQRWLLCHAALALHFRREDPARPGLTRRDIGQLALRHAIASRNTAYAFFDEALKYGVIRPVPGSTAGEGCLAAPSPATLTMLAHWFAAHLQALDLIDKGDRTGRFQEVPELLLALAEPEIARALLADPGIRQPGPLYSIFTWADAGGLLMDRLIAGIGPEVAPERDKFLTDVSAISHLAEAFGLSRAHTSRKFAAAESIGGVGWSGRRGRSRIWISRAFHDEYARAQAQKLAIIEQAFVAALARLSAEADNPPVSTPT